VRQAHIDTRQQSDGGAVGGDIFIEDRGRTVPCVGRKIKRGGDGVPVIQR
jgi:hypothetical protein